MNIVLFDGEEWEDFLPLTFTRPVAALRMGILSFAERWEKILNTEVSYQTKPYLQEKFPAKLQTENTFINPTFFPNEKLIEAIKNLKPNQTLIFDNQLVAVKSTEETPKITSDIIQFEDEVIHLQHSWDLFTYNFQAIEFDFDLVTKGRTSQSISTTNQVLAPEKIFIEEGAKVEFSILNASEGPIYIGKDAEIMEGSMIRGGLALCEHAKINMGAKIYAGCTIGPFCKVGGELNNSILIAYSNKGHDGFLGNSVIGEWCNLGADTNNSNLKNNYAEVKLWSYNQKRFVKTGLQFCGLIMGDYAKSAINTQFNTGTVVGVCANVFQSGFPPNMIKHYSWGGQSDAPVFNFDKACEAAEKMMERRKIAFTLADKRILEHIFNLNNN
ncbi:MULTISPECIES: GlmU family protein [Empedobacter]|uniref:GlmU family protein n=2 Tax=Weeksellaceae TaxID=2762318 RepID=UPI0005714664|nr:MULTISPECIES: GlmU family protein [Empedobacter]MBW1618510.1 glucose-1-phosphate thymidylyltransferase [Empedobacter falsenii]MDH0674422.1 GlmU family protein [Empedobacter sp. GD03861]MDH1601914.1 GlmU family protein [Empedobacter sp. GD03739]HBX62089.1 glucose-1-phosphate thymidylyltransferase [Flavobacteriaceae bacterium]